MRPKFRFKRRKKISKRRLATRHDRIMTLANSISISRIALTFPLVYILNIFSVKTQEMAIENAKDILALGFDPRKTKIMFETRPT